MQRNKKTVAVVIPVYGNEETVEMMYQQIVDVFSDTAYEFMIQFVNDRSPDNSQQVLEKLVKKDRRVRVLLLSKNHGSHVAIFAGLNAVKNIADGVVIMSADLQDPPTTISSMLASWEKGNEAVLCTRKSRKDPLVTKLFSFCFNYLNNKTIFKDMPAGGFDFCLIDKKIVNVVINSYEKDTNIFSLILWSGFTREVLEYDRQERPFGKSMWSFRKKIRFAINSIVSFSHWPLKLFILLGVLLFVSAVLFSGYILLQYFKGTIQVAGWTSLILVILATAAFNFLGLGVLGEYLWNNLNQTRKRPLFIVDKETVGDSVNSGQEAPSENVDFFNLSKISDSVIEGLRSRAVEVLSSKQIILGENVAEFENRFSSHTGIKHTIGVANGTDALTLALWACGISTGDKVITTSLSAPPTAVGIIRAGAVPVFVDIEPDDCCLSVSAIKDVLDKHKDIKAIVPVHLYGNLCDMEAISTLAKDYDLKIIEDCAQSFGSHIGQDHCGSFSDAAAFSFYPTKNLGAYGDAGAVVTNDDDIAARLKQMRFYGQNASGECVMQGMNSRLDEMQAALLIERLTTIDEDNLKRKDIAKMYDEGILSDMHILRSSGAVPHLYVIKHPDRDGLRKFLKENYSITTGIHYAKPLPKHSYIKDLSLGDSNCPNATRISEEILSLPCFPGITVAEVKKIIFAIKEYGK